MNAPPTIFVVDDDYAVRDSLGVLFRSANFTVETFASGEAFLQRFDSDCIGCLILDLKMTGMSGIDLQQQLSRRGSQLPIVFLSAHATVDVTVRAIKGGAFHFLVKPFDPAQLIDLAQELLETSAARQRQWRTLSEREREVLACLASGLVSKTIADRLDISVRTVEGHRTHLMHKLKARSAMELASIAHRLDLTAYAADRARRST